MDDHQLMFFFRSLRNDDIKRSNTTLDQPGNDIGTDPLNPVHFQNQSRRARKESRAHSFHKHANSPPLQVSGHLIRYNYGLHSRCNTITHTCSQFPEEADCHGEDRYFCSMWRSIGFLMSFAVVIEGMTLITFVVMLAGGKQKRESGWKIISGFLVLVGLVQCTAMALIVSYPGLHRPRPRPSLEVFLGFIR